jgi:hypothetical protein
MGAIKMVCPHSKRGLRCTAALLSVFICFSCYGQSSSIDEAIVAWKSSEVTLGGYIVFSVDVGSNRSGLPVQLQYKAKNIFDEPMSIFFPNEEMFASFIGIGGGNMELLHKNPDMRSPSIEDAYTFYEIAPNEEKTWSLNMKDVLSEPDEFYSRDPGYLRISYQATVFMLPTNREPVDLTDYERIRTNLVWYNRER